MQAHCQSRTSQPADQSFVKELAKPTQRKIVFKIFPDPSKKNKKHNAQPTDNDTKTQHRQWFERTVDKNTSTQQAFGSMAGEVVN